MPSMKIILAAKNARYCINFFLQVSRARGSVKELFVQLSYTWSKLLGVSTLTETSSALMAGVSSGRYVV
jgi:hypothetical protein